MKKKISLLLVAAMLLTGCNTAEKVEQTTEESTVVTTESVTETATLTTETKPKQTSVSDISSTEAVPELETDEKPIIFDETIIKEYFLGVWESEDKKFVIGKRENKNIVDFFNNYGLIEEAYVNEKAAVIVCENFISERYRIEIKLDNPEVILFYDETEERRNVNYTPKKFTRTHNTGMYTDTGEVNGYIMSLLYNRYGYIEFSTSIGKYTNDHAYLSNGSSLTVLKSHNKDKLEFVSLFVDASDTEAKEAVYIEFEKLYCDGVWKTGEWKIIENTKLPKTPIYDGANGEVFYLEDADISQEPFYAYHFTYVHTGGEFFRINEGDEYGDYSIRYARHIFYPYEDEFVEWGGSYQFDDTVTLNGKLETFKYMSEDEPELFLTITVDENPGFPFPYYIYDDYPFQEILINLGKPEKYSDNDEVMDFVKNKDAYSGEKFSVSISYLCIAWVDSNMNQSSGYIEKLIKI